MFSRRKRNQRKINFKLSKEIVISLTLVLLFALICISFIYVYQTYTIRANFEADVLASAKANEKQIFSFDKMFLFSSSDAVRNNNPKALWDLNLYQYTDIAIYLNNHSENGLTKENTIKELYIDAIEYGTMPEIGTPTLYYKDVQDFGKSSMIPENVIQDRLHFSILSTDQALDSTKPNLYSSGKTPITLEFINQDIKKNAIISNIEEALVFDGSLLKKANISLSSLSCHVSFTIHIINNLEEHFVSNVSIEIPLENVEQGESILNGSIKKEQTNLSNYVFYKTN